MMLMRMLMLSPESVADGAKGEGGAALICGRGSKRAMLKERLRISKLSLAAMIVLWRGLGL